MNPCHRFRRNLLVLAAPGFLGVSAAIAAAQSAPDGSWTTAGPTNQIVTALAADPANAQRLFAGTELGVFRTDDGGSQWTSAPTGLEHHVFSRAKWDLVLADEGARLLCGGTHGTVLGEYSAL